MVFTAFFHARPVQGAFHTHAAFVDHVGVDHGGGKIVMSQKFLNGPDITSCFQKLGGETVAEGMGGNRLDLAGQMFGPVDGLVDRG